MKVRDIREVGLEARRRSPRTWAERYVLSFFMESYKLQNRARRRAIAEQVAWQEEMAARVSKGLER